MLTVITFGCMFFMLIIGWAILDHRIDKLAQKFDSFDERFNHIDKRLDDMDIRLRDLNERVTRIESKLD